MMLLLLFTLPRLDLSLLDVRGCRLVAKWTLGQKQNPSLGGTVTEMERSELKSGVKRIISSFSRAAPSDTP